MAGQMTGVAGFGSSSELATPPPHDHDWRTAGTGQILGFSFPMELVVCAICGTLEIRTPPTARDWVARQASVYPKATP